MDKWYNGQGNNSDVVMSARVRLVRNMSDMPFPRRMSKEIRKTAVKKIYASIQNSPYAGEFDLIDLSKTDAYKAQSYGEKQFISQSFCRDNSNGIFLLSKDEDVSIMLCGEDHIRLLSMTSGQDLQGAYSKANAIDDVFIHNLKIAFDEKLGFLSALPTNLGTGMKASFDLHLPALAERGMVYQLSAMVGKLGLSLRHIYSGNGAFFRLENQITLGITEQAAIDNMNAICNQIVKQERTLREYYSAKEEFEDKVFRAMGTLLMARRLSTSEFFELISLVRAGISMGFINKDYTDVGSLISKVQTATIQSDSKADITVDTAEKIRAKFVREILQ